LNKKVAALGLVNGDTAVGIVTLTT
jgi:hypothetical protein